MATTQGGIVLRHLRTFFAAPPSGEPSDRELLHRFAVQRDEVAFATLVQRHAAMVLCCLEGATRDEAARALGWSCGPLKRRLERGRALLRQRLLRRGLQLSAALGGALLGERTLYASLPPLMVETTVKAVVGCAN